MELPTYIAHSGYTVNIYNNLEQWADPAVAPREQLGIKRLRVETQKLAYLVKKKQKNKLDKLCNSNGDTRNIFTTLEQTYYPLALDQI